MFKDAGWQVYETATCIHFNEQMGSEGDRKAREMRKGRVGGRSRVLKALFRCLLEFSLKEKHPLP